MLPLLTTPLDLLGLVWRSGPAEAGERARLIDTLEQLRPALSLAASDASDRFVDTTTARYANAVTDLHCQARLLGRDAVASVDLEDLADSFGRIAPCFVEQRLSPAEAQTKLDELVATLLRLRSGQPT